MGIFMKRDTCGGFTNVVRMKSEVNTQPLVRTVNKIEGEERHCCVVLCSDCMVA